MLKPEDVLQIEFHRALIGYDMKEVDALLDAVVAQMEAWEKERDEMLTALDYLLREIEQYEQKGDSPRKKVPERVAAAESKLRLEQAEALVQEEQETPSLHFAVSNRTKPHWQSRRKQRVLDPEAKVDSALQTSARPHGEDDFEIPTYVFAGSAELEDADRETAMPTAQVVTEEKSVISSPLTVKESELSSQQEPSVSEEDLNTPVSVEMKDAEPISEEHQA